MDNPTHTEDARVDLPPPVYGCPPPVRDVPLAGNLCIAATNPGVACPDSSARQTKRRRRRRSETSCEKNVILALELHESHTILVGQGPRGSDDLLSQVDLHAPSPNEPHDALQRHAGDTPRRIVPIAFHFPELLALPDASTVCKEIRDRAEERRESLGRLHKRWSEEESRVLAHLHGLYSPIARRGE